MKSKIRAVWLSALILAMVFEWCSTVLAAESLEVKVPVIAHGADCTAVLYDSDGETLQTLELTDGVENHFTISCDRLERVSYTIRLSDEDTDTITYDRTVYEAAVTLYHKPSGELGSLLEIRYAGDIAAPKKEIAGFTNEVQIPFIPDPAIKIENVTVNSPENGIAYKLGEVIQYKLIVTNIGNMKLKNARVQDEKLGIEWIIPELDVGERVELTADQEPKLYYTVTEEDVKTGTVHILSTVEADNPNKENDPDHPILSDVLSDQDTELNFTMEDIELISIDPPVKKNLTGDEPETAESFTFVLSAERNTAGLPILPMPAGTKEQEISVQIEGSGEKEFGIITFTRPGTYVYRITETNTSTEHYTYDSTVYTLTAVVTSNGAGLVVNTILEKDGTATDAIIFTNIYSKEGSPAPLPEATPTVTPEPGETIVPEVTPTSIPKVTPSEVPEATPTETPEITPTEAPEATPTETPEITPTEAPGATPTETPEQTPTESPEAPPTDTPEVTPTEIPEATPTMKPTEVPEVTPTGTDTKPRGTASGSGGSSGSGEYSSQNGSPTPKTGDESQTLLWLLILICAILGMSGTLFKMRNKKNR